MPTNGEDYLRRSREKVSELVELVADARKVLIITHDAPDPDALASAVALRFVLKKAAGRDSVIAYGGAIGRPENRALAGTLRAGLRQMRDVDPRSYRVVALVDAQPRTGNSSLPAAVHPAVVIDHHQIRKASWAARFTDIRPDYGATSTILTEYLQTLDVPIPPRLATALFYGIKSDTRNLDRSGSAADSRAFTFLFPLVGQAALGAIEHARVSRHDFEILKRAIDRAVVYGNVVMSHLGRVEQPDDIASSSDELVRLENIRWAAALGLHNGDLCISLRSGGPHRDAGRVLRRVVGRAGAAGGHGAMAAARIPLRRAAGDEAPEQFLDRIRERLLEILGAGGREGRPLVPGAALPEPEAEEPSAREARDAGEPSASD